MASPQMNQNRPKIELLVQRAVMGEGPWQGRVPLGWGGNEELPLPVCQTGESSLCEYHSGKHC